MIKDGEGQSKKIAKILLHINILNILYYQYIQLNTVFFLEKLILYKFYAIFV